ncbi:MAG: hypothetical protein KBA66_14610 [Leptospiraceae bacterium]|nr:hypothetical protein [Leptospiraceae bacterium]
MLKYIFAILLLVQCNPKVPPLSNTFTSKEEVLQKAFEFVSKGDEVSLNKLLLTREEHNTNFWNHVGERFTSDPGMNADLAFEHMNIETTYAKQQLFHDLKGKYLSVKSSSCGRVEKYGPFKLHLGCKILAINPAGNGFEISGIRTVIELDGRFKLYHLKRE